MAGDDTSAMGRVTIAAGVGALPGTAQSSVLLKALSTNAADIEVGNSGFGAGTGYPLSPGETVAVDLNNIKKLSLRGTNGDVLAYWEVGP